MVLPLGSHMKPPYSTAQSLQASTTRFNKFYNSPGGRGGPFPLTTRNDFSNKDSNKDSVRIKSPKFLRDVQSVLYTSVDA